MSSSLNRIQIIGNITTEPLIKNNNGKKLAVFSIATNRNYTDSSWEKQQSVEFHECIAWESLATLIEQYATKWKQMYVEWYMQTRSWVDDSWAKKYKKEIVSENIVFMQK